MTQDSAVLTLDAPLMAIFDIGKTRSKLVIVSNDGSPEYQAHFTNSSIAAEMYQHLDTNGLWNWMSQSLRDSRVAPHISRCIVVTHGAAFALLEQGTLACPVMDYEFDDFASINTRYETARDRFEDTYSPSLPVGLNAGRQLFYIQHELPKVFDRVTSIVPYPQYWAARLCGVIATECTSLGTHTDLWRPSQQSFSSLATSCGWVERMPPLRAAWENLGPVLGDIAANTGLSKDCDVICGVHDSNASYLRHLGDTTEELCVVSTGTWVVCMAGGSPVSVLDPRRDMLANVDVFSKPVPCARFMGGREYEVLANTEQHPATATLDDALHVMRNGSFALPSFTESGGPYADQTGKLLGPPVVPERRRALASLYCALVTDVCLDALGASGGLVIEGRFVGDSVYLNALAHFRAQQIMRVSDDDTGTVGGAIRLLTWPNDPPAPPPSFEAAGPADCYIAYRNRWRELQDI